MIKNGTMDLYTPVELPRKGVRISHRDKMMLFGSCFTTNIGNFLSEYKFTCEINPFGIQYNPLSVARTIHQIINNKRYSQKDLVEHGNLYHSYMHHGEFSGPDAHGCLERINSGLEQAGEFIRYAGYLFITFGTAYVYTLKETGEVVSNCHKVSSKYFDRRLVPVDEIVNSYQNLIDYLKLINPALQIIFTVSPIRHLKDGLHANQISKSVLLLAINKLQECYPGSVHYFPAYEILMDELRDYRFYADDLCHPSPLAIRYIWERFEESYFDRETREVVKEIESVKKGLNHRPVNPESIQHKAFLRQLVLKIERLKEKYPYLDVDKEIELCLTLLKE